MVLQIIGGANAGEVGVGMNHGDEWVLEDALSGDEFGPALPGDSIDVVLVTVPYDVMLLWDLRGLQGIARPYSGHVLFGFGRVGPLVFFWLLPSKFGGGNVVFTARGPGTFWGRILKWVLFLLCVSGSVGVIERGTVYRGSSAKGNLCTARRSRRDLFILIVGRGLPRCAPARSIVMSLGLVFRAPYSRFVSSQGSAWSCFAATCP